MDPLRIDILTLDESSFSNAKPSIFSTCFLVISSIFVVSTSLPGAAAEDVEELVTDIIEDRLQSLPDIDSITSTSQQGFSQIVVSFNVEADADEKPDEGPDPLDNVVQR